MWSEKKGSNPGGKGTVLYNKGESLDIYIKYCTHSRLHASHPFKASNQPIYEAVTLGLAKKIGLEVPKYFLLVNEDKTLKFNYKTPEAKRLPIDEKRE